MATCYIVVLAWTMIVVGAIGQLCFGFIYFHPLGLAAPIARHSAGSLRTQSEIQ
jgi:hypothetical protein